MKREWVVYGAYEGDKLLYIGKTGNLAERKAHHCWNAEWAGRCTFRILRRARSEAGALRIEARLIMQHQPPYNIQHNPGRGQPGALSFEEANRVWHDNPTLVGWALIAMMPGWTMERARRAFGPQKRVLIWRRPRVADGPTRINPKLYRLAYHPAPRRAQPQTRPKR